MLDQILLDIINEHLPYEIDMLRGLYGQFGKANPSPTEFDKNIQYFAQINSFCVQRAGATRFLC